jgi:hypothetical protein
VSEQKYEYRPVRRSKAEPDAEWEAIHTGRGNGIYFGEPAAKGIITRAKREDSWRQMIARDSIIYRKDTGQAPRPSDLLAVQGWEYKIQRRPVVEWEDYVD